jgi:hypothetical protein
MTTRPLIGRSGCPLYVTRPPPLKVRAESSSNDASGSLGLAGRRLLGRGLLGGLPLPGRDVQPPLVDLGGLALGDLAALRAPVMGVGGQLPGDGPGLSVGSASAEWLTQWTRQTSPSLRATVVAPVERATACRIRSVIADPFWSAGRSSALLRRKAPLLSTAAKASRSVRRVFAWRRLPRSPHGFCSLKSLRREKAARTPHPTCGFRPDAHVSPRVAARIRPVRLAG